MGWGERLPNTQLPAVERLDELRIPLLIIIGAHDIPYMHAAATYVAERLPSASVAIIKDAAHLPNMDHPDEFQGIVTALLDDAEEVEQ